jgi:hypothetical protein
MIIADHAGGIDFWDLKTGKVAKPFQPQGSEGINCLARSPDGRWLAGGLTTQSVKFWNLTQKDPQTRRVQLIQGEKHSSTDHIQRVVFSPDSKTLYCNSQLTGLSALDVVTGKTLWNFEKSGFIFVMDTRGKYLVAGGGSYEQGPVKLNVIDTQTGKLHRTIEVAPLSTDPNNNGNRTWVSDFVMLPDTFDLISFHYDMTIRIHNIETGTETRRIVPTDRRVGVLGTISPDGKWLALSGQDRAIQILEVCSGKSLYRLGTHDSVATQVSFTPDGRTLLTSADLAPLSWDIKPTILPDLTADEETWTLLASEEGAKVYPLQWSLVENPEKARKLFAERIKPADWQYDLKRYEQLIQNLDKARFSVREMAQKELTESLKIPLPWLHASLEKAESPECKDRLRRIIEARQKLPAVKEWQVSRAVQILELIGDADCLALLKSWTNTSDGSHLATEASGAVRRMSNR